MERSLFDELKERVFEYDVAIDNIVELERGQPTALVKLSRGDQHQRYLAAVSPNMAVPETVAMTDWTGTPLLVLGAKVTPRNADRLRALGINYLDANGNAYLTFGSVYIDVRGRAGNTVAALYADKPVTPNLFSPKRAQVIFALVSWPELVTATLQEIAECSRASIPMVQKTIATLESANFIESVGAGRRGRRLANVDRLIDGWAAAFSAGLASQAKTRSFRGDFALTYLDESGPTVYVSGEAVADWIQRHTTWTLYCDGIPREAAAAGNWTARSSEPNIFLRTPFWKEPPDRPGLLTGRIRNAPPLLVYADLIASGDPRQREAAQHYRGNNVRLRAS